MTVEGNSAAFFALFFIPFAGLFLMLGVDILLQVVKDMLLWISENVG